jgi:hypothetical protein
MKGSKFSEQQIAFILRQAEEGVPVGEVAVRLASASRPITVGVRDMVG